MSALLPPVRRIKQVRVVVEYDDGEEVVAAASHPGHFDMNEGLTVTPETRVDNEVDLALSRMEDMVRHTTVTWVERWTEYLR